MKTKNKKKAIPKHFLGALLSTGVGLLTSNIAANKANNAQKEMEIANRNNKYKEELYNDSIEAKSYQDTIENGIQSYYKKGGKMAKPLDSSTKGGVLKSISSDMVVAKGNKHEESKIDNTSGIKLLDKGKPFAEIEDDETIKDGQKVYSDRLKVDGKITYADAAEKLAKEKNKIEVDKKSKDLITNNTNERKLAILDKAEDDLFIKQEQSKENMKNKKAKIPKGKDGMFLDKIFGALKGDETRVGQIGKAVVPFIDNIGNALITSKTPKIAGPTLERVKSNKTKVNVAPQLAAITDGVASTTEAIKNNTSNSNTARANIASANLQGAKSKAQILANKENTETQLYNQNQNKAQQVTARNANKIDNNNMQQTMRANDIGARKSANLANLAGDFIDKRNFDAVVDYQDEQLDIIKKGGNSGVSRRAQLQSSKDVSLMKANPEKYYNIYKGTPEEDMFLKATGYDPLKKGLNMNIDVKKLSNIPNNLTTKLA